MEGGSTLTQQLARTIFLSNVKTFARKIKEGGIALLIEAQLSKKQILEFYLNRVYLSAGVYGVETMSQHLFRKTAAAVTLPEAAFIAGLIRAPSALSPWSNYEGALERSHVVLAQMRAQGLITAPQYEAARQVRPRIQPYRQPNDVRAGFAKEFLRQQFRNEFGGDNPPDWQVHTAFLPAVQDAAERAVASGLDRLRRPASRPRWSRSIPSTGDILAMVGGANYARSTYNRAVRSRRQPGSAFKPFVYAAALANGYSPVSVLTNLRHVSAPGDPEWSPRSEGEQPDALTLRAALLESNNPAAADLQQRVGSRAVLQAGRQRRPRAICPMCRLSRSAAASSRRSISPSAYTMFPGDGQVARPRGMISVFDSGGRQVFDQAGRPRTADQPGGRVSNDQHAARRHRARHRSVGARPWACAGPWQGRPVRPTTITTPGLSATRPRWSSVSGSGSISRPRSGATPTAPASRCRSGRIS